MKHRWFFTLSILLLGITISGCITIVQNQPENTKKSNCDPLAQKLDDSIGQGISGIDYLVVGGTLVSISEPQYFDYRTSSKNNGNPADYVYTLTFQGQTKKVEFKAHAGSKITIPLSEGQFYQFELLKAYGEVTSMGPHNSMFPAYQIDEIFQPVEC